jgi:hypothetical protein
LGKKENFYENLQAVFDRAPKRDIKILMGDFNAQIGSDNLGKDLIMGKQALGVMNENGELFSDFCAFNDSVIAGSIFPHRRIHKATWTSPDGRTENQIDHICISRKWRRSLRDTRAMRGADVASDHHLLLGKVMIKLKSFRDTSDRPHFKFNTTKLKGKETKSAFTLKLKNRFEALANITEETTIEDHWSEVKEAFKTTCTEVLGRKVQQHKEWLTEGTWKLISRSRELNETMLNTEGAVQKQEIQIEYSALNRQVKRSARKDKRNFYNDLTTEAEEAAGKRDLKTLYSITRILSGKRVNQTKPVKDRTGKQLSKEPDQRKRWAEHFKELLNRPPPATKPVIPPAASNLNVNLEPPSRKEITAAVKLLKNGKAAGPDGIPPEALKVDINTSTDMLCPLLQRIWKEGHVPKEWKTGYLVKLPKKGDLSDCKNWRGIMLLSIPSKVLTRIILTRLKDALDENLRPEQAGFRKDKSCTDHIATLRVIIEQSLEMAVSPILDLY